MLPPWIWTASAVSAALGPLSHYFLWVRIELDGIVQDFAPAVLIFQPVLIFLFYRAGLSLFQSTFVSWILQSTYLVTLFTSIFVYRAFFHPAKSFPGPFWARVWSWWKVKAYVSYMGNREQAYKVLDHLHKKHGDVIRIGPRDISINDTDAISGVYASPDCFRGHPVGKLRHLQAMRDREEHKARRLMWDQGLNARVCQQYLPRMSHISDFFCKKAKLYHGKEIVINDWMHYFTFDIMGELGFGQSYGQIETGTLHPAITAIHDNNRYALGAIQVPWLSNIISSIPGAPDPISALIKVSEVSLIRREKEEPKEVDIMSFILRPASTKSLDRFPINRETLIQDSMLMQIAASDTSYSVLVYLFYYLVKIPNLQEDLRAELKPTIDDNGLPIWSKLQAASLLDSIIMETMRMHPAVPQGMIRETPRDRGSQVGPYWIPAETMISCPTWSLQRDERYWVDPHTWRPERWTTQPELIKDRRAFIPFSIGPTQCPGKYFALMEMKTLLVKVVLAFDIVFADGEDGSGVIERNKDWFTTQLPPLRLKMMARDGMGHEEEKMKGLNEKNDLL